MKRIIHLTKGVEYAPATPGGEPSRLVVTEKAAEAILREAWCAVQAFRMEPISLDEIDRLIQRKPVRR